MVRVRGDLADASLRSGKYGMGGVAERGRTANAVLVRHGISPLVLDGRGCLGRHGILGRWTVGEDMLAGVAVRLDESLVVRVYRVMGLELAGGRETVIVVVVLAGRFKAGRVIRLMVRLS